MANTLIKTNKRGNSMLNSIPTSVWAFVGGLFVAGFPNFVPFIPFV